MGSAASSSVKPVSIPQAEKELVCSNCRQKIQDGADIKRENVIDQRLSKSWVEEASATIMTLEAQVAELESQKLDLRDQVQTFEEQLQLVETRYLEKENPENCAETVKIKDAYIQKLEDKTKKIEDEIHKFKIKYKKRIRAANTKIMAAKQETSLRVFELKGEIMKLSEEKDTIQDDLKRYKGAAHSVNGKECSESADGRTQIILQLSQQISEQNEKISCLEQTLKDSNITQTHNKMSTCDHQNFENDRGNNKSIDKDDENLAEPKAISAEMKALKDKKRKKISRNSYSGDDKNRQLSGMSRDSGLQSREHSSQLNTRSDTRPISGRMMSASSAISTITGSDISVSTPDSQPGTRCSSSKTTTSFGSDVSDLEFDGAELLEDFIIPNEASQKLLKEMYNSPKVLTPVEINSPRIKVA